LYAFTAGELLYGVIAMISVYADEVNVPLLKDTTVNIGGLEG
jgi:hypothetical protein